MKRRRNIRVSFSRHELTLLINAIEDLAESYSEYGGTSLIQEELELMNRLEDLLHRHDGSHQYRAKAAA